MLPIAYAGHWIGSLLYVAPVALVALAIAFREMKGKARVADGDDDLADPSSQPHPGRQARACAGADGDA